MQAAEPPPVPLPGVGVPPPPPPPPSLSMIMMDDHSDMAAALQGPPPLGEGPTMATDALGMGTGVHGLVDDDDDGMVGAGLIPPPPPPADLHDQEAHMLGGSSLPLPPLPPPPLPPQLVPATTSVGSSSHSASTGKGGRAAASGGGKLGGGGGKSNAARRPAAVDPIGGVWSAATRGQYVDFLQVKKKLSKASVHSYCWRLETLFKALVQSSSAASPPMSPSPLLPSAAGANGNGGHHGNGHGQSHIKVDLDKDQLRALIEGRLAEAERLVAQDDRRSHWRLLKDFLGLEDPEPVQAAAAAERNDGGDGNGVDEAHGGGGGNGQHLNGNGNGAVLSLAGAAGAKVDGQQQPPQQHQNGAAKPAGTKAGKQAEPQGQGKVWNLELKRDYRAWLRERGVKDRTCGSYCTFVHNLLRALADARKPVAVPLPLLARSPVQNGVAGGAEENGDGAAAGGGSGTGNGGVDSLAAAAGQALVEPRREGLNRQELVELLEEQEEEAQQIVRQSKKFRYLRSFREFLGMGNPPMEELLVLKTEDSEGAGEGEGEGAAAGAENGSGEVPARSPRTAASKSAGPPDWPERIGSGFKRWVGTGRAGSGPQARRRGYVGAARSILRTLKSKGWVEEREGPLGVPGVGKAEVLAALEAHRGELLEACDKADDERVEALLGYLRAGRQRDGKGAVVDAGVLNGDGDGAEPQHPPYPDLSSMGSSDFGLGADDGEDENEEEGEGDWGQDLEESDSENAGAIEGGGGDDGAAAAMMLAAAAVAAAAAASPSTNGGGEAGGGKRKRPATSRERRLLKRIRSLEEVVGAKSRECEEARERMRRMEEELLQLRAHVGVAAGGAAGEQQQPPPVFPEPEQEHEPDFHHGAAANGTAGLYNLHHHHQEHQQEQPPLAQWEVPAPAGQHTGEGDEAQQEGDEDDDDDDIAAAAEAAALAAEAAERDGHGLAHHHHGMGMVGMGDDEEEDDEVRGAGGPPAGAWDDHSHDEI